jgi:hypothetical protein
MRISIDVTGADERALNEVSQRLNVPPDALAAAALSDLLSRRGGELESAAKRILEKNGELDRRLA